MRLEHAGLAVRPRHGGRSATTDQQGQTLVEFAIVLPVFLLVLFGLIDVGRLVYTNAAVSQAAREGARLAAAETAWTGVTDNPACVADASLITAANPGAFVCPLDVSALKSHVTDAAQRMTVAMGPVASVHLSCNTGADDDQAPSGEWTESSGGNGCADGGGDPFSAPGDLVSVRVLYDYQFFTPIISTFLGPTTLSGSATMTIN